MRAGNLFSDNSNELDGAAERVERLAGNGNTRVERIVSRGHVSPPGFWYDQDETEWVMVVSGRARLRFESGDEALDLGPGDHVTIPAHARHRVDWTDPDTATVWLAVFF
jgi:cupin 2 domain-containing protein